MAGRAEKKKPTTGRRINSRGKRNSRVLLKECCLGRALKSIITSTKRAKIQDVKIAPAIPGSLYPKVVLEKAGFIKGMIFAATVNMNQLTGQRK